MSSLSLVDSLLGALEVSASESYELFYWELGSKGALIRTLLRFAKAEFTWVSDASKITGVSCAFGSAGELNHDFPVKGPPILKVGHRLIGQTQVIATYLLDTHPTLAPKDLFDKLHCLQVIANATDVLGQLSMAKTATVTDTAEYNKLFFDDSSRFQQWLEVLESSIRLTPGHFHFESRLTAADIAVHWVLDGFRALFNFDAKDRFGKLAIAKYPLLQALLKELDATEEVKGVHKENAKRSCGWWPQSGLYLKGTEHFHKNVVAFYGE